MTSTVKTLGLIGLGQFGQLAALHLAPLFDILATDTAADGAARAEALGIRFGTLSDAAARDIVIVAVPVVAMPQTFEAIAPHLRPDALVIDVGSVKTLPSQWMVELLPDHVDLVATHPLFGPQSARTGLAGLRLVVCPIRGDRSEKVVALGRSLGLTVTVTTPEDHDREMAYVQALTHLIGRSLVNLDIPDEQLKTPSYQHLLELCALIGGDSFELFSAIQTLNPYASEVAESFVAQARSLLDRVAAGRG
jgi:prephenate dehydrogenase